MANPWRGRIVALMGVVLVALNMRIAVAVVSPISDAISVDVALTHGHWEALSVAPPLCFAIFGALAPVVSRRIGLEASLVLAMLSSAIGEAGRASAVTPIAFLAWTVPIMAGAGIGNVICPPTIKKYFPDKIGLIMGVYVAAVQFSSAIPPLFVTQLQSSFGWRPALGVWAIVTVAAVFPWLFVLFGDHRAGRRIEAVRRHLDLRGHAEAPPRLDRPLWRTPMAWALTCVFFVNSIVGYTMFAWMPDLLRSAGLSSLAAAHGLALWALGSLPGALLVPVIVARMKRFLWVLPVVFFAGWVIGFAGLALSPAHGTVAWITITRFGDCFFPFSLTLVNLRTKTHEEATAMSGFVQSVGYTIASAGPWAFGALFAATGRWEVSVLALMAILPIQFIAGLVVSRPVPNSPAYEAARPSL